MWIIDSHVHIGNTEDFNLREECLVDSIHKYRIGMALVSNIEGNEFDGNGVLYKNQEDEIELNKKTLYFVKKNRGIFRGQYWIKANLEKISEIKKSFLRDNLQWFCGLKIHPFHSCISSNNESLFSWYKFCEDVNFPVSIHTADDDYSHPDFVFEMAKKFPRVNFIMVHMGLQTDHRIAIDHISKLPNLYGDTTWVIPEMAVEAVKICGSKKILFGTDSPIDGIDTYEKYKYTIGLFKNQFNDIELSDVLCDNARRLFINNNKGYWRIG